MKKSFLDRAFDLHPRWWHVWNPQTGLRGGFMLATLAIPIMASGHLKLFWPFGVLVVACIALGIRAIINQR